MDCRNELQPESMPKPSSADIDSILIEKFPGLHLHRAWSTLEEHFKAKPGSIPAAPLDPKMEQERQEIERLRKHLEQLTAAQVAQMAGHSRAKLAAQQAAAAEQAEKRREAARFYNLPSAAADFKLWSKARFWTADEAAALLLGRDPRVVNPKSLDEELSRPIGFRPFARAPKESAFHTQFSGLRTLLQRTASLEGPEFNPSAVIEWAQADGSIAVPKELSTAVLPLTQTASLDTPGPAASKKTANSARRWTPELLKELSDYRAKHGTKAAAEHFDISTGLVRQKLPKKKPPAASPFPTTTHRIK